MRSDPIERVLRGLYSAALYVLLPVTAYHLIWRGFRQRAYFRRWNERYAAYRGLHDDDAPRDTLWVHAVSVGEVNAAAPVVNALRTLHPHLPLLITTITPTGSARVRALWGDSVQHVYLPYDIPGAVRRFFEHFRPRAGLILETELWPNLLFGARDHGVPTYILNARLSARSLRGYRVLAPIVGRALRTVRRVGAQSKDDARRFVALGAKPEQVVDLGNLKFDTPAPEGLDEFRAQFRERAGQRPTWIAASTHEGEEADVIALHKRLREKHPDLLLLWAPRHPERFRAAVDHAHAAGWKVATRRLTRWPGADDDVFVIDTLGELMAFYACAQVAFVGGSLQPIGGHNLLEPAAVGTAIVTGPHLHNFVEIARRLDEAGAVCIEDDVDGVFAELDDLLEHAAVREQMTDAGLRLVREGRGALARSLEMIAPVLPLTASAAGLPPTR
ncbi:3-deoxy-D-manno-octulosonic-acid transferase [Lysobacter dokdonensis DS-58]|uniref:3-deoxy-D-manno-octulosonic acid transferase n=1 Tax=Lysobacter dokdonensis DS-58 TaxID=1300345 RepID=A0A0A2WHT4_9GAMM|nr:lipid IV(A) 3-deoxy-D-manno-octulosonic acid transferase [Lysobacter dokdonensis]KGQ18267.1 3-deoxy-D-manno-octulosonic-acid transferase [Lysobacter dokdonensis DS-58]